MSNTNINDDDGNNKMIITTFFIQANPCHRLQ